ncbi:MAG: butyrate kinase [Elusimicrobiota bacterium]|jgi:butyrate kinase
MYEIEKSFDAQLTAVQKDRPVAMVTEPLEPRILEAVCHLTRFIKPVLLATEAEVRAVAAKHLSHLDPARIDYALSQSVFVDVLRRKDLLEEFAAEALQRGAGLFKSLDDARDAVTEPGRFGLYATHMGHADLVVGGATHSPKDYFRPMLKLLGSRPVCEVGVFVLPDSHPEGLYPHNIVVFGDVGVNAVMTPEVLAEVAVGTCEVARDLFPEDVLPEIRAAIVSYSHKGSDEGPSPEMVRQAMPLVEKLLADKVARYPRYGTVTIAGEVKISTAISQRSAGFYKPSEEKGGGTNVIICPNLETGNLLFHLFASHFPDAKKFAVLYGLGFRGVDLAMDCSPEDVRLAVKAAALRLQRDGRWDRTPRDTFFRRLRVLAVNPGSTSTKIAVYEGESEVFTEEVKHEHAELAPYAGRKISEQFGMRKDAVLAALGRRGLKPSDLDAVAGRGGLLRPIPHGTYRVSEAVLQDLKAGLYGDHASNLGGLIAHELAAPAGRPSFIVDPVVVDDSPERVKITGLKSIRRKIISHALNQIASVHRFARETETFYEKVNAIVCHLGGGISVGAHRRGRYIDANNALDGEGPFSPERCGSLPVGQFAEMCFSGRYTYAEVKKLIKGAGGLVDLLGTSDLREVERRVLAGESDAVRVLDGMAYQIARHACALLPAFEGEKIDRVIITGGMARCASLMDRLRVYLAGLGVGITVYPGENEMVALVQGALRVLYGREAAREYAADAQVPAAAK